MSIALTVGFILGIAYMVFITPVWFSRGVLRMEFETLNTSDKIKSLVPIVNAGFAEKVYYGRKISSVHCTFIAGVLFTVLRFLLIFGEVQSYPVQLASIYLMIIAWLGFYLANVLVVYFIIKDADTKSPLACLLYAAVYPFGQYYIGEGLRRDIKWEESIEEDF